MIACREHPFGPEEIAELSRSLYKDGQLETALIIGIRANRSESETEERTRYLTSYLQSDMKQPSYRVPLPEAVGDIRRWVFNLVTDGILVLYPITRGFSYPLRHDGRNMIREGLRQFNKVMELRGISFDRVLHFGEPLSAAFACLLGRLYNLPVEEIDKDSEEQLGLIAVYDGDLLEESDLLFFEKRREGQILFAHALPVKQRSCTPDVVTHLYKQRADQQANAKALKNLSAYVVSSSKGIALSLPGRR